jgi:erythromycin esterase
MSYYNKKPGQQPLQSKYCLALLFILLLAFSACEEKNNSQSTSSKLVESLREKSKPLNSNPLQWTNAELEFLDAFANKRIVGLGESTHGTKEFFNAKYRIFKYLVENHGYNVFAFEADWGASMLINKAVLNGESSRIETLMKDKMFFWTWKTEEVKNLLMWMCKYNKNRPDSEKIHYIGIDCQFNRYNTQILQKYLTSNNFPHLSSAIELLDTANQATEDRFSSYNAESFEAYLSELSGLKAAMDSNRTYLIEQSSLSDFKLHCHTLDVIEQVSKEVYYYQQGSGNRYRDKFMAENATWTAGFFENGKTVLWAHNSHIADEYRYGTGKMGYYLKKDFGEDYSNIGLLFSTGSFRARGRDGEKITDPMVHTITAEPKENSLNSICYRVDEPAFFFSLKNLLKNEVWNEAFIDEMEIMMIGATFSSDMVRYRGCKSDYMDCFIYFDKTNHSVPLE